MQEKCYCTHNYDNTYNPIDFNHLTKKQTSKTNKINSVSHIQMNKQNKQNVET